MVFDEHTIYATSAAIAFIATVICFLVARRFEGETRHHMLVAPTVTGILALGYLGMATNTLVATNPEGEPVYVTRFIVYCLTYSYFLYYVGLLANARYRYRVIAAGGFATYSLGAMFSHWLPDPAGGVFSLVVLASVGVLLWVLLRPFTAASASVSGERQLVFSKTRNLFILVIAGYLMQVFFSRQALGLLDAFVGVFNSAYIDLLGHIGLAGLLLSSQVAVAELSKKHPSPVRLLLPEKWQKKERADNQLGESVPASVEQK